MMKAKTGYILELPLHGDVSRTFKSFVKDLGNPIKFDFISQFFNGRLRLSSATMPHPNGSIGRTNRTGRTASVLPRSDIDIHEISKFASKLNVAMSLSTESRDIILEVSRATDSLTVLRAIIIPKTIAAEMALNNVWTVIESSTRED